MNKFILLFLSLWLSVAACCSDSLNEYENVHCFDVDKLGNVYLVNGQHIIIWNKGERFRYHTQGNVATGIHTLNGFEILVFFEGIQSFQLFDNRLSPLTPITQLNQSEWINTLIPTLNNEFWMHSRASQMLGKLSRNRQIISKINQTHLTNTQLVEDHGGELLAFDEQHIYLYNQIGALIKDYKTKEVMACTKFSKGYLWISNQTLHAWDGMSLLPKQFSVSIPNAVSSIQVWNNQIYILSEGKIIPIDLPEQIHDK